MALLGLLTVGLLVAVSVVRLSRGYLAEIINSFLPYTTVFLGIALAVATSFATTPGRLYLSFVSVGWILLALQAWTLVHFGSIRPLRVKARSHNLRAASFNKLITSNDIEAVFYHVLQLDVDIVGLLEVRREQVSQLRKLAEHHKLHLVNRGSRYERTQLVLISKSPLTQPSLQETDTFGKVLFAQVRVGGKPLHVMLLHMAAPAIPSALLERNHGLAELAKQANKLKARQIIMMGDFNLTPWSLAYRDFRKRLGQSFYNTSRGWGIRLTWVLFGFVGAHIDHIIVSKSIKTRSLRVDKNLGSDHRLIYAELKL